MTARVVLNVLPKQSRPYLVYLERKSQMKWESALKQLWQSWQIAMNSIDKQPELNDKKNS
ncbi:hypothetical protein FOA20_15345 [Peribacillus simplex]